MRNLIDLVENLNKHLYHGTSLWSFLMILGSGMMRGSNDNDLQGDFNERGVSFTSDKSIAYKYGKDRAFNDLSTVQEILDEFNAKTIVILTFDAKRLYRDFHIETARMSDIQKMDLEERVLGDIPNVSEYLLGYTIYNDSQVGELLDAIEAYALEGEDRYLRAETEIAKRGISKWSTIPRID